MSYSSYRKLVVWQKSMDFVVGCYQATKNFPSHERFGLASQLQRSSSSIPANIAEGQAREHRKEYLHHLSIAHGSLAESETHILLAERLAYIDGQTTQNLMNQAEEIGRMLNGLRNSLK